MNSVVPSGVVVARVVRMAKSYRLRLQNAFIMNASATLSLFGIVSVLVGFVMIGSFWGSLIYLGISWLLAAGIYFFADREVTDGGLLAALLLGFVGAIVWVVVDTSRTQSRTVNYPSRFEDKKTHYVNTLGEEYKCRNCRWFGDSRCKRKETLINANPCEDFLIWGS